MYTAIGTYYSFLDGCLLLSWFPIQPGQKTEMHGQQNINFIELSESVRDRALFRTK